MRPWIRQVDHEHWRECQKWHQARKVLEARVGSGPQWPKRSTLALLAAINDHIEYLEDR
ncbi:MAG: hypothetical protein ACYS7Y_34845 [Planctomycetota bacterium]